MKATRQNVEKVFNLLLSQLEDENGRGEFDNESDLLSSVETCIKSLDDEDIKEGETKMKGFTINIPRKIKIGKEINEQVPKEKYMYRAYRQVMDKYKISECTAKECYEIYMAYMIGRSENR